MPRGLKRWCIRGGYPPSVSGNGAYGARAVLAVFKRPDSGPPQSLSVSIPVVLRVDSGGVLRRGTPRDNPCSAGSRVVIASKVEPRCAAQAYIEVTATRSARSHHTVVFRTTTESGMYTYGSFPSSTCRHAPCRVACGRRLPVRKGNVCETHNLVAGSSGSAPRPR